MSTNKRLLALLSILILISIAYWWLRPLLPSQPAQREFYQNIRHADPAQIQKAVANQPKLAWQVQHWLEQQTDTHAALAQQLKQAHRAWAETLTAEQYRQIFLDTAHAKEKDYALQLLYTHTQADQLQFWLREKTRAQETAAQWQPLAQWVQDNRAYLSKVAAAQYETQTHASDPKLQHLLTQGQQAYDQANYSLALNTWEQGLQLAQTLKHPQYTGAFFATLAQAHEALAQYPQALHSATQALAILRDIGDRENEGAVLGTIGSTYSALSQYAKALDYHEQALVIDRELGDRKGEGTALNNIGVVYESLSQYAKALEYYEQALVIHREIPDRQGEGTALTNIGVVYQSLSQYAKALEYHEQALAIHRAIRDRQGEGAALTNIGLVYDSLSQYAKALEYYEQALVIHRAIRDSKGVGNNLSNIGVVYQSLSQYAKALEYYEQALEIKREIGDRKGVGNNLSNIGVVYQNLGQYAKALEYYEQALVIHREIGDRQGEGADLSNIGLVYYNLGQYAKALEYHEQALVIHRAIPDRQGEGATLSNIGVVYRALSQYAKALEYYEQALEIKREIGDRTGEGSDLNNLGVVYHTQGDYPKARATYQQALQIVTTTGEPENLWRIWKNLFDVSKSLDNPLAAIFYGKQAVNTLQTMRGHVAKLEDKSLHASFLENKTDVYQDLADLLIAQGRIPEAQQVMELLKQEEYFDYLRRRRDALSSDSEASLNPLEQAQQAKLRQAGAGVIRLGKEYEDLRRLPQRSEAQEQRLKEVKAQLKQAGQVFNRYLDELFETFAQAEPERNRELGERQLAQLRSLQGTLRELGAGVVLLHYLSLEDKLHIIVTTGNSKTPPVARQVAVKAADLHCAVANFRALLSKSATLSACGNSPNTLKALAKHLHGWLIAPIAEDLRQAKAQTLLLYLDGSLRYIPFAALRDGDKWLMESYASGIYTAAAQTKLTAKPQARWRMAGLGVSKAYDGFDALPGVEQELKALVRGAENPDGLLEGVAHLNEQFNYARFQDLLEDAHDAYPVFHIASHFRLNPGAYDDSFLLLGDGEHLNLKAVKDDNLDFNGLDLLTLSACNTATGGTGAEIEGFGTLAQNQGAKSVLASLWKVDDQSTSAWMQAFYAAREEQGLSKLAAMRQAQLALLANEETEGPYHWAAFILMGNGQ